MTEKRTPVKERSIYVYVPTNEMAERWKRLAKKAGLSISAYIQNIVENHIGDDGTVASKGDLDKRLSELEGQNSRLRSENLALAKRVKMLDVLTDRYEEDLRNLKNRQFEDESSFEGIREYEPKLIKLLKEKDVVKEHELLDLLHIDPSDTVSIKAINQQLDNLFAYNLIKRYKGGYIWLK